MSLRLRLTLIYSTILAVTLAVFSLGVYSYYQHTTRQTFEALLEIRIDQFMQSTSYPFEDITWPQPQLGDPQTYWQAVTIDGVVLSQTDNLTGHNLPISDSGRERLLDSEVIFESIQVDGATLLVHSEPIEQENDMVAVLQVAYSLEERVQSGRLLQGALLGGTLVIALLAVGIGWMISGTALRPLHILAQTAQVIGAERDFERRIADRGINDEIGHLSQVFNIMLSQLQSAYAQVTTALERQQYFTAAASHELRTPLTSIRGNLGLLQRVPPITVEDREEVINDTVEETDRLIRLVRNLLTLAHADAETPPLIEAVGLTALVAEVERQMQPLAAGHDFRTQLEPGLEPLIDPDHLKQVLLIMLDNAFKFTSHGGEISVTARKQGEMVQISVHDTGIGIPPEEQEKVFTRFYKGQHPSQQTGHGLGLAIAERLIRQNGGTITVQSAPGRGTTFIISLRAY